MDFMNEARQAHETVYSDETGHNKSSFTHNIIAGAVGFEAMKAYEDHLRQTGESPSHSTMKELLAGLAAAEVDKLIETKGLDKIDAMRAKQMATEQAYKLADEKYG